MLDYLWVALGGALGSVARVWAASSLTRQLGGAFPFGTLVVNVTGSFVIGFVAASTGPDGRWPASPAFRTFFMGGLCGGYTTFSSFSLQTLEIARDGQWWLAGLNIVGSVVLCLAAVWLGYATATWLQPPSRA